MAKQQKPNPWPYSIIGFFVIAIIAITGWVGFAMRNNMELVRADYYEQDVLYQQQIERLARTSAVREEIKLAYDPRAQRVHLRIPESHGGKQTRGVIHFYRPSDASLDQKIELAVNKEGSQRIDLPDLRGGLWKVNVSWSYEGQEYYFEQPLVLSPEPRRFLEK